MKLLELWIKYQNSGLGGCPVITDAELIELKERLQETREFIKSANPILYGLDLGIVSVKNMIYARKGN